jgi:hypothetical protein
MTNFTIHVAVYMAVVAVTFWAVSSIIIQAGYSKWWIIVPLAPSALTIACLAELWNDVHNVLYGGAFGFIGIETVGLTWKCDEVAMVIAWLFLLVFALARWPAWYSHHGVSPFVAPTLGARTGSGSSTSSIPVPAPVAPRSERGDLPRSGEDPTRPSAVATEAPVPFGRVTTAAPHCTWCGEALPGSRVTFHNCGSKDRPAIFCTKCGTALAGPSMRCPGCASA